MRTKKIKLKTKLLESLGLEDGIVISVSDCKETYKTLVNSSDVIDWEDYVEEEKEEEPVCSCPKESPEVIEENVTCECDSLADNFNDLATWIEAVWRVAKVSPAIIYGSDMFNKAVRDKYTEVAGEPLSIEHVGLKTIMESYYTDDFDMAKSDVNERLKTLWKGLGEHPSLTSVAVKMFKK